MKIPIEIINNNDIEKLKKYCKENIFNGGYINFVCKKCGSIYASIDSNTEDMILKKECIKCSYR